MKLKHIVTLLIVGVIASLVISVPVASAQNDVLCTIFDCSEDETVSFSGFKGGLEAPTASGLDTTLTRATDARSFIVNTVNFILSFLGLVAMVVVIYGGFLYVTAAGNEEQSGKGKKAIQYAAIGIVIIIASFAIVNTLITSVGGDGAAGGGRGRGGIAGSSGVRGVGEEGSNIGQQAIYNLGAAEINASLNDFVAAYRNLASISSFLTKIDALPGPRNSGENGAYIAEVSNFVNQIKNQAAPLSETRQTAQKFIDEYLFSLQNLSTDELQENERFSVADDGRNDDLSDPKLSKKIQELEEATAKEREGRSELDDLKNERQKIGDELTTWQKIVDDLKETFDHGSGDNPRYSEAIQKVREAEDKLDALQEKLDTAREALEAQISSRVKAEIIVALSTRYNLKSAVKRDFHKALGEIIGPLDNNGDGRIDDPLREQPSDEREVQGRIPLVWKIMGEVASLNAGEAGAQALQRGLITEKDLQRAFAGIDANVTVGELFVQAIAKIHASHELSENIDNTQLLVDAAKALERLYIIVKDIQFVFVRVKASSQDGNAPLIVELNGLDSRDPTGRTIPEEAYVWDPDGDGENGISKDNGVTCGTGSAGDVTGPTITCTYNRPGTYRVRLSVASADPQHIAAGQAFLSITVKPSVARISLKGQVGQVVTDLRKYEQDQNGRFTLVVDKNEFQVTTREATGSGGVTYDASESRGGGSGDERLQNFRWNFGHPEALQIEGADKSKIEKHVYPREGKFTLTLEVTDIGNRKDRKIVAVSVASIAARFTINKDTAEPDELIELDGGISRSDHGQITDYTWSILDKNNVDVLQSSKDVQVVGNPNSAVLKIKFKNPGSYQVNLKVSDGTRSAETSGERIKIKSRKPRVSFQVLACPDNCPVPMKPSVVDFDGSASSDPDPQDELTYGWQFFNELGDELKAGSGITFLDPQSNQPTTPTLPSKTAKRVRVQFSKVGKYKVKLTVNDSHPDLDIRQEESREREFSVESIVEATLEPEKTVVKLEGSSAPFVFKGTVKNANLVKLDYGDGQTCGDQELTLQNNTATYECKHSYEAARTYTVTLNVSSEEGNGEVEIKKRVYVTPGNAPFPVLEASVDNVPHYFDGEPTPAKALDVVRNKPVAFDASNSVNSAGTQEGLKYSWDFGDGKRSTGKTVKHSFDEVSPTSGPYKVTLTITEDTPQSPTGAAASPATPPQTRSAQAFIYVNVISKKPTVRTLALEKKAQGNITPIEVELRAEGAVDPEPTGRITNFQFWYYDPADKTRRLSVIDTSSDNAGLTVETSGEEGQEREYVFCVSVTDNTNLTATCDELFTEEELPHIKVKNGPNNAPTADFTVDKTSVKVGDPVTFSSSSRDSDGQVQQYIWDLQGDGFQNDTARPDATVTHTYDKPSPRGGYRVKLKVIDDRGAAGYSKEIPVFVDLKSRPPEARFNCRNEVSFSTRTVKCYDESVADKENGAQLTKWYWDFDTSKEYGCSVASPPAHCNGNGVDDIDSTAQNPITEYAADDTGTHQIQLIVEDLFGTKSEPAKQLVTISALPPPPPPVTLPGGGTIGTSVQGLTAPPPAPPASAPSPAPSTRPSGAPQTRPSAQTNAPPTK